MTPGRLALALAIALPAAATATPSSAPLAPAAFAANESAKVMLEVPYFGQTLDEPWGGDFMGDSRALIADNGCIMSCAAMSLAGFGADTDPGRLNRALVEAGLYSEMSFRGERLGRMGFSYESIRVLYPGIKGLKMRGKIRTEEDAELLRKEIRLGRPVILTVAFRGTYNHAILAYGFEGRDFLVRDPMDPGNETLAQYAARAGNPSPDPFACVIGSAVYSPEPR